MAEPSNGRHELAEDLTPEIIDRHRAFASLIEELEAVDWYEQRAEAARDDELRAIIAHNRDEEKEHAAMLLEWLRRRDTCLDASLRAYLFRGGPIVGIERESLTRQGTQDGSLAIGSLREDRP